MGIPDSIGADTDLGLDTGKGVLRLCCRSIHYLYVHMYSGRRMSVCGFVCMCQPYSQTYF